MTETEWLTASKPYPCQEIARDFGTVRKLRLLMVGFLEPIQDLFSEPAKEAFRVVRDWAEDEQGAIKDRNWSAADGPLADYMQSTTTGLAAHALSWIALDGSKP